MQIWGKFFGGVIGFIFGRFFGALFGIWLGHKVDQFLALQNGKNRQTQFFNTAFAVMGHIAKSTGQVTTNDIRMATSLMDLLRLDQNARLEAQQAFRDGKRADFDLVNELRQFRRLTFGRRQIHQMFLEIQIQTALSDGQLQDQEYVILQVIARELGFNQFQLDEMLKRWQAEFRFHQSPSQNQGSIADAYEVLGLDKSATDKEIKRAYHKLMNENHPDKLIAKGLPDEMMAVAKQKTQDIQAAYDRIKQSRAS